MIGPRHLELQSVVWRGGLRNLNEHCGSNLAQSSKGGGEPKLASGRRVGDFSHERTQNLSIDLD